jgi:aromatic-L-amino-acid decarboxylase
MLLRAYGKKKYTSLIQQNLDQINYLAELIEGDDELELTAPVVSNVVCFRFRPKGLDESETEKLNRLILNEINKKNFWMISNTTIKGKYMLRACNVNHRTKRFDMDFLIREVKEIGHKQLLKL